MTNIWADLRYSIRTLARSPLFTAIAVISLALGIGANTAIFTFMDQLMLRQLPIKDPESLVMLDQRGPHNGSNMGERMNSYPIYQDYQKKAAPLAEVACRRLAATSISVDNTTERVEAELVSGNYFSMLGVGPAAGRVFRSDLDDRTFMGQPTVVLSYDYWVRRFHASGDAIGKKILVNNYPMTIVGVSAPGFKGLDPAREPQIRVPILMEPAMLPEYTWVHMDDRRTRWVQIFARLKPGYTAQSAQPAMQLLFHQIREYESTLASAKDWTPYERKQFLTGTVRLTPAATGYSQLRNSFSTALIVLMCMVGLVLLIACANVANLLIARAFARQKEIAVRLSIGASRGQLTRQLLVESLVLSSGGAVIGVLLAITATGGLLKLIPAEENPLLIRPYPDWRILCFTLFLTVLTSLIFGLVPALRASNPDLWNTLKDAAGSIAGSSGSLFLRKALVAAQVALSFLLLFGAGLFVKSMQNLRDTNTGFHEAENLITFQLSPASNGYDAHRALHLYTELLDQLRALPGIRSAGLAGVAVLAGDEWDSTTSVEGHKAKDGEDMQAFMNMISPGYFAAMGVPILAGRDLDQRDIKPDAKDGDPRVAIVNETFARHFFGSPSNALGRHLGQGMGPQTKMNIEIVGVTADSLYEGPREGVHRQVFVPHPGDYGAVFYVRAGLGSAAAFDQIKNAVRRLAPRLPVSDLKTLQSQLDETLVTERLVALLSASFGFLATVLAAVGLYGVMTFVVTRRTKELGVRMALGAKPATVIWLVMREVILLLALGLAIGIPAAIALGGFVAPQLYHLKGNDPGIAMASILLLIAVACLAGLLPAQRASRIDPMLALRYE